MNRYILKYKGSDERELVTALAIVKKTKNLTVIDGNAKLMLVETDKILRKQLPDVAVNQLKGNIWPIVKG